MHRPPVRRLLTENAAITAAAAARDRKTPPTMAAVHDRLLTPEEVAALARVEPRTVGVWRRTGRLPGVQLPGGRVWRYQLSKVAAVLGVEPAALLAATTSTPRGTR